MGIIDNGKENGKYYIIIAASDNKSPQSGVSIVISRHNLESAAQYVHWSCVSHCLTLKASLADKVDTKDPACS